MASTGYLALAMTRVAAMVKEAMTARYSNVIAQPFLFYAQEAFPYCTVGLGEDMPTSDSELLSARVYAITARWIIGHKAEGVSGDLERRLYTDIPTIENFFEQHIQLTCAAHPLPLDDLAPVGITINVSRGLTVFENSGIGVEQIGTEFRINTPFNITIDQLD